jgi:hypothetical protein
VKIFINSAAYFSKHGANVALRLFMAFFLLAAVATVYPSLFVLTPFVGAAVVAFYVFTISFNGKRTEGMAALTTQADIFNVTQLQVKDIVQQAIAQHYGERSVPEFLDKLIIRRKDLYAIKYLTPLQNTFKFFDTLLAEFFTNVKEVSTGGRKMYVLFGIQFELATGAAANDAASALNFTTPVAGTDEEVLNGEFSFKINTKTRVENSLVKSAFVNDDAIKNYFRFPQPIVWEPSNQAEIELRLSAAYAAGVHKYGKFVLVGYELSQL